MGLIFRFQLDLVISLEVRFRFIAAKLKLFFFSKVLDWLICAFSFIWFKHQMLFRQQNNQHDFSSSSNWCLEMGFLVPKLPKAPKKKFWKKKNVRQGNWQKTILNLWSQQIFWRKKKCKNLFEFHLNPTKLQRVWKNILFLPGNSSSRRKDHSLQQWSDSQSHKLYIWYIDSVLWSWFENIITARNSQCTNS